MSGGLKSIRSLRDSESASSRRNNNNNTIRDKLGFSFYSCSLQRFCTFIHARVYKNVMIVYVVILQFKYKLNKEGAMRICENLYFNMFQFSNGRLPKCCCCCNWRISSLPNVQYVSIRDYYGPIYSYGTLSYSPHSSHSSTPSSSASSQDNQIPHNTVSISLSVRARQPRTQDTNHDTSCRIWPNLTVIITAYSVIV